MKYLLFVFISFLFVSTTTMKGKYITKNGKVSFYSDAPLEKIEAKNNQLNAAIDANSGEVYFKVLIKSFLFEKALMQEHFNENYMESDKFPTATYKGKITNLQDIDFAKAGKYSSEVEGKLTIHGVTKDVKTKGTITVLKEGISVYVKFKVQIGDYDIKIPGAVAGKIAEEVEITVDADLKNVVK
ncbi:MAG: YceI family protein [Bacteroidales bacterium]|nr:YceI family protein [Bacteroidales bacterium]